MSLGQRLLLVALALAVFLPGIGSRDLWNPDEPRYAEVALEMRATGDWFVPHLNGRVYAEKPPLHFWAIAAAASIPGVPIEVAARLPALLAAIAALLLVAEIGRRLFDPGTGLLAALIFLSASKILWQGRIGQIDMTLTALMLAGLLAFVRGVVERRPELHRWFFFFAGLATLAKGPVGLLPPLAGIVLFAFATGRRQLLADIRLPSGLLIWAAVVLAWLVPAGWSGGREYLATIVLRQNVTRYAEPWHHFQPWYYYLEAVVVDFFPWSFFLPGAVWIGLRRTAGETARSASAPALSRRSSSTSRRPSGRSTSYRCIRCWRWRSPPRSARSRASRLRLSWSYRPRSWRCWRQRFRRRCWRLIGIRRRASPHASRAARGVAP
jgi:4-amino-4-deoxy-L-arabinose transferase-like glycosyltransferase